MVYIHVVKPLVLEPILLDLKPPFNSKDIKSPFMNLINAELIETSN
jgi:hypothetical protein